MRYWRRVAQRAWADTWRLAEPHKGIYGVMTGLTGLLCAWAIFGVAQPADWWKVGLVGAVGGIVLPSLVVYAAQFLAAPARLDRELSAEIQSVQWHRSETYTLMASLLEDINQLRLQRIDPFSNEWTEWDEAHGLVIRRLWTELKPRVKDHEFYGLLRAESEIKQVHSLTGTKYLLLPGLMSRIVELMERYAESAPPPAP